MDLFRVNVPPDRFAGSIFDLQPATTYEVELHATDPDGPVDQTVVVQATTRGVPTDPLHPAPKSVSDAAGLQAALDAAQPGDVITLALGIYRGPFEIAASGTADDPIVIRGVDEDGVVLDGHGCDCNLLEVRGRFVHVERLTLQNALRGLRYKTAGLEGNVARRLHLRAVTVGIEGDPDQRDFYACDNVLEGRLTWPFVYTDDGGHHSGSDDGINVKGHGHVVCHNDIVGFGDAMKIEQAGARADDFYGNEVRSAYDNALELDYSEGNTRAFRNRFTNAFVPISFQPTFGGPVYALRNVVVNVAEDQLKFYAVGPGQEPNGVVVLHNTFVSPGQALYMGSSAASHHFVVANNLFVGPASPGGNVVTWVGTIDDGTFDHDGFFPDGTFDFRAAGTWSSFAAMQAAGAFETHGVLLEAGTFASGLVPPASYRVTMAPADAALAAGSNAIDAGLALPNVNDGAMGAGPDLGALERGCPSPLYGVRPEGVDETNEPFGCGGPTVTTTTLPYVTIQTTSLKLSEGSSPASRRVSFKSTTRRDRAEHRIVLPPGAGSGDPTVAGATLAVYNAGGGAETVTVALPASGWTITGSPGNPTGYGFRSADPTAPIASVRLRADRLQVKGGRASWTYPLSQPPQRRVALRLTVGDRSWCAASLAKPTGSPPSTAGTDQVGLFVAQPKSPPPLVCPPPP
ncbi:MAG TPA: hypothetical protein VKA21_02140 [Candidatus Binatia bacterium]|nr:hypothetical protein [Candidatus Binatia bacterium]